MGPSAHMVSSRVRQEGRWTPGDDKQLQRPAPETGKQETHPLCRGGTRNQVTWATLSSKRPGSPTVGEPGYPNTSLSWKTWTAALLSLIPHGVFVCCYKSGFVFVSVFMYASMCVSLCMCVPMCLLLGVRACVCMRDYMYILCVQVLVYKC